MRVDTDIPEYPKKQELIDKPNDDEKEKKLEKLDQKKEELWQHLRDYKSSIRGQDNIDTKKQGIEALQEKKKYRKQVRDEFNPLKREHD